MAWQECRHSCPCRPAAAWPVLVRASVCTAGIPPEYFSKPPRSTEDHALTDTGQSEVKDAKSRIIDSEKGVAGPESPAGAPALSLCASAGNFGLSSIVGIAPKHETSFMLVVGIINESKQ